MAGYYTVYEAHDGRRQVKVLCMNKKIAERIQVMTGVTVDVRERSLWMSADDYLHFSNEEDRLQLALYENVKRTRERSEEEEEREIDKGKGRGMA